MCGICGEIRSDGRRASAALVERMADRMAPRGPDGAGIIARGPVAFGHRRLKIIDLTECAACGCAHGALKRPNEGCIRAP